MLIKLFQRRILISRYGCAYIFITLIFPLLENIQ